MSLQVGQQAPDFTLKDQHGQDVTLSSCRGSRAVIVVFFPFAFTGVCTGELGELRDALPPLDHDDVALLAVSCDSMFSLRRLAEEEGLGYPLLSDFWPHGETARAYGVLNEALGCAFRGTFVIDRDGVVRWKVENAMPDARSVDDYRAALARL